MVSVNTVLGPIDTSKMGFTLCHEHVMTGSAGVAASYPELVDRDSITERAVEDLSGTRVGGVSTMVDLTTFDLGRDVRMIRDAAQRSGMQIIVATGTWLEVPRTFWQLGPDVVSKLYVRELEQGIDGTDIRAGVIKVANDEGGVTERGEVVLRAAARAHLATGAPIYTHTWAPERVGRAADRNFRAGRCRPHEGVRRPQQRHHRSGLPARNPRQGMPARTGPLPGRSAKHTGLAGADPRGEEAH